MPDTIEESCRREVLRRAAGAEELNDRSLYEVIDRVLCEKAKEEYLTLAGRTAMRRRLFDSFRRLDILQELLEDETVTEIMVNGHRDIFVERDGKVFRWQGHFESRQAFSSGFCLGIRLLYEAFTGRISP